MSSFLSEFTQSDINLFSISNPTPPTRPPIEEIKTIAYNGSYWIAGGIDTAQTLDVFTYGPVNSLVRFAMAARGEIKSLLSFRQTLINQSSTIYSTQIRFLQNLINNKNIYYKSLLNSARSKFKSLKTLGYVTEPSQFISMHSLMISYDGITWNLVDENPFQFYTLIENLSAFNQGSITSKSSVADIKWNSTLSLWVAVGGNAYNNRIWAVNQWKDDSHSVQSSNPIGANQTPLYATFGTSGISGLTGENLNNNFAPRTGIATSPDGLVWTSRGLPGLMVNNVFNISTNQRLYPCKCIRVACSSSLTIVLGEFPTSTTNYEYIATSVNCITWALQSKSSSNLTIKPKKIAYNGAVWVIVGDQLATPDVGVRMQISTTGTSWTNEVPIDFNEYPNFKDVAWNGITWMAIGQVTDNNVSPSVKYYAIYTSPTGNEWTRINRILDEQNYVVPDMSLVWDGSFWLINFYPGNVNFSYKTEDGITLFPLNIGTSIVCTNIPLPILGGKIDNPVTPSALIVGYGLPTSVLRSSDETDWTSTVLDIEGVNFLDKTRKDLFSIAWCNSFWLVVGNPLSDYNGKSVVTSTDGFTWSYPSSYLNGISTNIVSKARDVIWTGSLAIVVGDSIATSPDGNIWTRYNSPFRLCNAIAWNGKTTTLTVTSFATSSNGTQVVTVTSNSGISVGETISIRNATDIFNNGTFLITALGTNTFTWANSLGVSSSESSTVYAYSSLYVAGANDGRIAISVDANSWLITKQFTLSTVYDIAWNGSIWVAVGVGISQCISVSIDGIRWYTANADRNIFTQCNAVAWNRSLWVAVGIGRSHTIATSVDGYNWIGRGNDIFTSSGDMIAFNGTNWIGGGSGFYQLATSTNGITWSGANEKMVISRCYANKTVSLPYTGTASAAVKTLVDQGLSTITTLTNNTLELVQTLNNPYVAEAALAALAAAEALRINTANAVRLGTKISATKYIWEYIYWNYTIKQRYDYYISQKNFITTYIVPTYSSITNFDSLILEIASLPNYLSGNLSQMLSLYSTILNDTNDQTILDKNLLSIYIIHSEYKSNLLRFYENLRNFFYVSLYEIYTKVNALIVDDTLLDTIGYTANTEKTKSSVLSSWDTQKSLLNSTYTTARNFFVTPITSSITFTPENTVAKYTPPSGGTTIEFRVTGFAQPQSGRQIITVDSSTSGITTQNFTVTSFANSLNGTQVVTVTSNSGISIGDIITIQTAPEFAAFDNTGSYVVTALGTNTFTWANGAGINNSGISVTARKRGTITIENATNSANNGTYYVFSALGNTITWGNSSGVSTSQAIFESGIGNTNISYILSVTSSNAPSFSTQFNNFDYQSTRSLYIQLQSMKDTRINIIDKYYNDTKVALIEWKTINNFDFTTGTTFSAPSNGIQTITVSQIENIQVNRVVTISDATNSTNNVKAAIVLSVSGNTFTIQNSTGVAATSQAAIVNYSDSIISYTALDVDFNTLKTTGETVGMITINKSITSLNAFLSWGESLISFYKRKSKYYYDNYSNVYNYSNDLYRLTLKFKYSLNLLEFDRKDAITYAEQQLTSVRNEVNYFQLTTRQGYPEELLTMRNHYLRLLTTAVYDSSLYERVLKLSDIIFIGSRVYPTYSTYLQNVDLSIILAEADGCKPSINGWGGALYAHKITRNPQLVIVNSTGVASSGVETALATFVFVPKIIGFGTPAVNGFQQIYTSKIDNPVNGNNIKIGTFISITGASNSVNNVTNSTICAFDNNTGTIIIYNLKGVAATNQNASGFRSFVIRSFVQQANMYNLQSIEPDPSNSSLLDDISLSGKFISITGASNSGNNKSNVYVSEVQPTQIISVAVPGKQEGASGWLYFNNVYYAIQSKADFENTITFGTNPKNVSVPYSLLSSEIQAGDDGSVTISGNSNSNNNGTFKISSTNGTHIFISNSTFTPTRPLLPLTKILIGYTGRPTFTTGINHNLSVGNTLTLPLFNGFFTVVSLPSATTLIVQPASGFYFKRNVEYIIRAISAPSSNGIQTMTYITYQTIGYITNEINTIPIIANRYVSLKNTKNYSANNVINALVLTASGNTFTIYNPNGVASNQEWGWATYSDYDFDYSLSNLNATAFSAVSNGVQIITVSSTQSMTGITLVTITGASNSQNNVSGAIVESVSGNTLSIRNPLGIAATNQSATIEPFQTAISVGPTSSATYGTATVSSPIIAFSEPSDGKQRLLGKLQTAARVGDSITITGSHYSANNVTNAIILDILGNMISILNQNGVYEYGANANFTTSYPIFEITSSGRIDISTNLIENNSYKPFQYKSIRNTYDGANKKNIEWDIFKNFTETQTVVTLKKEINDFDTQIDGLRADNEFTEAFMNTKRDNDIDAIENAYLTAATTYLNTLDVKITTKIPTAISLTITAFSALTTDPLVTVLERTSSSPSVLASTLSGQIIPSNTNIIGSQQYNTTTYQTLTVDNAGTIEPYKNSITITGASSSGNNVTRALVIDVVGNTIKIINPNGVAATSQTATGKYGDLVDFANQTWYDYYSETTSDSLGNMVNAINTSYNTFLTIKNSPLTAITTTKTITSFTAINTSYIFAGDSVYYNTQVITVNSIGNILPRMTVRITGATNSRNNGIFKVLVVSGNTFTIENSRGVAATNSNAGSASYISFDYSITTAENAITTINEIQQTEAYITILKGIEVYRKQYTNAINLVRRVGRNLGRWINMKSNALKEPYPVGLLSDGRGKPFIVSIPPTNTNYWTQRSYTSFVLVGEENTRNVSEVNGSIVTVPPLAVSDVKSYSNDKNYSLNDYVSYNGKIYCCIKDDTDYTLLGIKGVDPLDITSWEEIQYPDVEDEFGNILEATAENFPVIIAADNDPYTPTIKYKNGSIVSGYYTSGEISTFYTPSNGTQKIRVKNFDGIDIGETITITGAANDVNNGTFTIVSYERDAVSGVPRNIVELTKPSGIAVIVGTDLLSPNPIAFYRVNTLLSFTCIRDFFQNKTITNIPPSINSYYWVKRTYPYVLYKGEIVEANFANFQTLAQLNDTPIYDNTKPYGKGDTVKYNNNFYYLKSYNDKIYIQGKPPGTTFPRERSWYELPGYSTTNMPSYNINSYYQQGSIVKFNNKNYFLKMNLDWMLIKNRSPGTTISSISFAFSWIEQSTPGEFTYTNYNADTAYENGSRIIFATKYYLLRIFDRYDANITNIALKNRNPNFGSLDVVINATWIEVQTIPTTYVSNKTGGYAHGDTVLYNDKYYYYEAPIGFNINGIAPDTTNIASEVSWQQITHPIVFTISPTSLVSGYFLECNTNAFSPLNYNDYPAYSSSTTYDNGYIVRVGQEIFQFKLSTLNVIGINITNRDFWRPIRNPRIKYNNQWIEYSSNLVPKLDASKFTAYNPNSIYLEGSIVSYNIGTVALPNLKIFRCVNDNPRSAPIKGKLPTSTNFWKEVTYPLTIIESKLIEANPTNPIFKKLNESDYHEYENNWLYNKGDVVSYNGLVYECTNVNPNNIAYPDSITGKSPLTTSGFWEQLSNGDLDFINNRYYKTDNIFPWNPITNKKYATGTTVLWKGYLYKSQREISYKAIIDLNSTDDNELIKSYIPSINETIWRKIDTDLPTNIPKVYSNTATYYLGSEVMIHDFSDVESVITSIISPFRIRVFKLIGFNKYEPQRYKYPELRILNEIDADGFYKRGIVSGTSSQNGTPRYGLRTIDPFRLENFAGDLKRRVTHNVLLPYLHAKNNAKSIIEMLNIRSFNGPYVAPEYLSMAFIEWSFPQAFNFKDSIIAPDFAETVYNKLKQTAQVFVNVFNLSETNETDVIEPIIMPVSTFSASSNGRQVVTVITTDGKGLRVGDIVTILAANNDLNNGSYEVTAITLTTFTWKNPVGVSATEILTDEQRVNSFFTRDKSITKGSIRTVLGFVYYYLTKTLIDYRQNVITYQTKKNELKTRYYVSPFFQSLFIDDPYPYLNVVALAQNPPVRCVKDLGVGDPVLIERLEQRGKIPEGSLDSYFKQKEELDNTDAKMNIELFNIKTLINYNVLFHYTDGVIGADIKLPIDYYYIDGYTYTRDTQESIGKLDEPSINIAFFILGPDDWDYKNMKTVFINSSLTLTYEEAIIENKEEEIKSFPYGSIINGAMESSLKPPEYTLPGSQAQRDLLLLTYESKDPTVNALGKVAKGLVAFCAAAFQAGDMASGIFPIIEFIGNWAITGKPDGEVTEDMPGGRDFIKFSMNTQGLTWPQFNERAQSIRNVKEEVKAYRNRLKAAKVESMTDDDDENLGDALITIGALILLYQTELAQLEEIIDFELKIETTITQKTIKYPTLLNPQEPTKITIDIPPRPTKIQIAYDDLSEELKRLKTMYQNGIIRNQELQLIKLKNVAVDAQNGKIKRINDGITSKNAITQVEKATLNKRIRYLQTEIDLIGSDITVKTEQLNNRVFAAARAQAAANPPPREAAILGEDVARQRNITKVSGQKMRNSRGEVIDMLPPNNKTVEQLKAQEPTKANVDAAEARKKELLRQLNEAKEELAKKKLDTFLESQKKLGIFDRVDVENIKKNIMNVLQQIEDIKIQNAAVTGELLQYLDDLVDAEAKQAAADLDYNKRKIEYEQQKLNVKNAQNAFDRDIAFTELDAKRNNFLQKKIIKDNSDVQYTFAKNQFTVKYLESETISTIMKRNMPPAVIAQYTDIINSFSTNVTTPIGNAYKSMMTNLKSNIVARTVSIQYKRINTTIKPYVKSAIPSKYANFLKMGGGPLMELAGIAVTTYSMLKDEDERLDGDTTDPFAELAGRALEGVAAGILAIDPYAGV